MKKIISLLLVLLMLLVPFGVCTVQATEASDVMDPNDMFEEDFELSNEEVASVLDSINYIASDDYQYMPFGGYFLFISYHYPDETRGPDAGFETPEELYEAFWEDLPIKKEYAKRYFKSIDIYSNMDIKFLQNEAGLYNGFTTCTWPYSMEVYNMFEFNSGWVKDTASCSSIETAYLIAKFFYSFRGSNVGFGMDVVPGFWTEYDKIRWFDTNYDGKINVRDQMLLKKVLLGEDVIYNTHIADANYDNKLNVKDSLALKRYILYGENPNWDDDFRC